MASFRNGYSAKIAGNSMNAETRPSRDRAITMTSAKSPMVSVPDAIVDITDEVCPMTFVRTRLALDRLKPGQTLLVSLRGTEPLRNVPRTARNRATKCCRWKPVRTASAAFCCVAARHKFGAQHQRVTAVRVVARAAADADEAGPCIQRLGRRVGRAHLQEHRPPPLPPPPGAWRWRPAPGRCPCGAPQARRPASGSPPRPPPPAPAACRRQGRSAQRSRLRQLRSRAPPRATPRPCETRPHGLPPRPRHAPRRLDRPAWRGRAHKRWWPQTAGRQLRLRRVDIQRLWLHGGEVSREPPRRYQCHMARDGKSGVGQHHVAAPRSQERGERDRRVARDRHRDAGRRQRQFVEAERADRTVTVEEHPPAAAGNRDPEHAVPKPRQRLRQRLAHGHADHGDTRAEGDAVRQRQARAHAGEAARSHGGRDEIDLRADSRASRSTSSTRTGRMLA